MKKPSLLALLCATIILSACDSSVLRISGGRQAQITGEPLLYRVHPITGELMDRDVLPPDANNNPIGTVPHKGEMITIVVKSIFARFLRDIGSPHVLVYAQVSDDGGFDPANESTVLIYNHDAQPAGQSLGLADRVIYGPTPYKGHPINIKLFIVELDKEDKQQTSQILSTLGSVGSAVAPQAAPAVGIFVQIAESLNALNEDDFELRYDMTLHPVGKAGIAALGASRNATEVTANLSRMGKPISRVASLQFGEYLVVKRELRTRAGQGTAESLAIDYAKSQAQAAYLGTDGELFQVTELYRVQGGYLKRVIEQIDQVEPEKKTNIPHADVVPRTGDNRGIRVGLEHGTVLPFKDRTHVVLSVITGAGEEISASARQAATQRDASKIAQLLDDANNQSSAQDFGARLTDLAAATHTAFELRRVSQESATLVTNDPSYRNAPEYVLFWTKQVDPLNYAGYDRNKALADQPQTVRNGIARNAAVLEALKGLVYGLPLLNPKNATQMSALHSLAAGDLQVRSNVPGRFELTSAGAGKF